MKIPKILKRMTSLRNYWDENTYNEWDENDYLEWKQDEKTLKHLFLKHP